MPEMPSRNEMASITMAAASAWSVLNQHVVVMVTEAPGIYGSPILAAPEPCVDPATAFRFPVPSSSETRNIFCMLYPFRSYRASPDLLGLPASGSWQDLKNHMGAAGEVCFADVYNDGTGMVEYLFYDDMEKAVRKLDDTKFRSHRVN